MVHWYPKYVPVGVRRARAAVEMHELRERGVTVQPVEVRDRNIVRGFWGRRWCEHLESFSDYANRLPGGRTYVRNGSVCHLAVEPGGVEAMVAGRELYRVVVRIGQIEQPAWKAIKKACAGEIGSVLELLEGRLPDRVMDIVAHRDTGLFPQPGEIELTCDCPDSATVCKHAAAVLYGVGSRLDDSPELLFRLRGVDEAELIGADMALPSGTTRADTLADGDLGDIFGIDLDAAGSAAAANAREPAASTVPDGATRAPADSSKPAASRDPAGAAGAPVPSAWKPAASAAPAGATRALAAGSLEPAASTDRAGATRALAAGSLEPAASTDRAGAIRAPATDSLKPAASTDRAGAIRAPATDSLKPAASTDRAGAIRAPATDSLKPAASTDRAGAIRVPAADSLKPAASTDRAGAARALAADSLKPAAGAAPAGATRAPAADSLRSAASPSPVPKRPKRAPRRRPPRADRPPALPRREDDRAEAPRFRPTGALIAELRERCGFSVAEFAELLQVTGTTVRRWEAAPGPLDLRGRSREALTVLRLEIEEEPE